MPTSISRTYEFESAHFLPKVPDGHRCKNVHGHHYVIELTLFGVVGQDGFVLDFWDIDKVVEPLVKEVDHKLLNDIEGLENPTAELIALWFFTALRDAIPFGTKLDSITVWETPRCKATYKVPEVSGF